MPDGLDGTCPIEDALVLAQAAGFEGLELCIGTSGVLTPDTTPAECNRIRAAIDAAGLTVQSLASGMSWSNNPVSDDRSIRVRSIHLHEQALQRAAWLGCEALLFVPGVVNSPIAPDESVPYEIAVERARHAVGRLLETAERTGVDLCLENVWNGLFLSPIELAGFIDSFDSSHLGIYFDAGNVMRYHQSPPHWIKFLGDRIKRVHVKGFSEDFAAGRYAFCDLGEGDVPWQQTMSALNEIGYDGTIVAEVIPHSPGLLERTQAALEEICELGRQAVVGRRIDQSHTSIARTKDASLVGATRPSKEHG